MLGGMTDSIQPAEKFDLAERTERFGERIIDFCKSFKRDSVTTPILNQLIRSGTSVGANYCEANEASSRKDFINKINIAKKESKETKYWLHMIKHAAPTTKGDAEKLWQEAHEFNLIFAAITRKAMTNEGR